MQHKDDEILEVITNLRAEADRLERLLHNRQDHVKLVYDEGKSSKFWEASIWEKTVYTNFGRIGTEGQTLQKKFKTHVAAKSFFEKKIKEKMDKGYWEV